MTNVRKDFLKKLCQEYRSAASAIKIVRRVLVAVIRIVYLVLDFGIN